MSGGREHGYDSFEPDGSKVLELSRNAAGAASVSDSTIDELLSAVKLSADEVARISDRYSFKLLYLMGLLLVFRGENKLLNEFLNVGGEEVRSYVNGGKEAVLALYEEQNGKA